MQKAEVEQMPKERVEMVGVDILPEEKAIQGEGKKDQRAIIAPLGRIEIGSACPQVLPKELAPLYWLLEALVVFYQQYIVPHQCIGEAAEKGEQGEQSDE